MNSKKLFEKFCKERNIRPSTKKGYISALKLYEDLNKKSIENLFKEARNEETRKVPLKDRKIKKRLVDFRTHLLTGNLSPNTSKVYFSKVKTFYQHFDFELPLLPPAKYDKSYQTNYLDLPTKSHVRKAVEISPIKLKAIILFMASSGTAKAETLNLTVSQFIQATNDYHNGGDIKTILNALEAKDSIVPTFYIKRIKTDKFYYTFCSPEATEHIIRYLKTRKNLKPNNQLFEFTSSQLHEKFKQINDCMNWGFRGKYRFFRSHTLRKFHASNIALSAETIDSLQGRSKNEIHETYIKTNPEKLKKAYISAMDNVVIFERENQVKKQEFNIIINVFLSGKEYNII